MAPRDRRRETAFKLDGDLLREALSKRTVAAEQEPSLLLGPHSGKSAREVAALAAVEAGRVLLERLNSPKKIRDKPGRGNIVTDADLLAEASIRDTLKYEYPDHNILSEESGDVDAGSAYTWVVDPLDGTNNYAFGIPFFSVVLALVRRGQVLSGAVYDPVRGELFWAEQGKGAFLNDVPISAAEDTPVKSPFLGCDLGYGTEGGGEILDVIGSLWPDTHGVRLLGSAALGLAYVACGRLDAYFHACIHAWDIASGLLLVREAGGEVTDWQGDAARIWSSRIIACGRSRRHRQIRDTLIARCRVSGA